MLYCCCSVHHTLCTRVCARVCSKVSTRVCKRVHTIAPWYYSILEWAAHCVSECCVRNIGRPSVQHALKCSVLGNVDCCADFCSLGIVQIYTCTLHNDLPQASDNSPPQDCKQGCAAKKYFTLITLHIPSTHRQVHSWWWMLWVIRFCLLQHLVWSDTKITHKGCHGLVWISIMQTKKIRFCWPPFPENIDSVRKQCNKEN